MYIFQTTQNTISFSYIHHGWFTTVFVDMVHVGGAMYYMCDDCCLDNPAQDLVIAL